MKFVAGEIVECDIGDGCTVDVAIIGYELVLCPLVEDVTGERNHVMEYMLSKKELR
jgi:hypothetical protein